MFSTMPCSKIIEVIQPEFRTELCQLIALCSTVATTVGKGYTEDVYLHALYVELHTNGVRHNYGFPLVTKYKGQVVGCEMNTNIIECEHLPFIVMVKANDEENEHDVWRLVRYMEQQGKAYGVVVMFKQGNGSPLVVSVVAHNKRVFTVYDGVTGEATPLRDYNDE